MNLFYVINDQFVPQLGAAICSVCENNTVADALNFYIGDKEITEGNRKKLTDLVGRYGRTIQFVPIGNLQKRMGFNFETSGWNEVIVSRLFLDELLPLTVKRILYLDADTIVRGDLSDLWKTDLKGFAIGGSIEPTTNHDRKKKLGLEGIPYINSGVLLIDLEAWRLQGLTKRILAFCKKHDGKLFAYDQDAINGAMKGEICFISPKYNYCNTFYYYPYSVLVKISLPAPYISEHTFNEAMRNPQIIHYLGEDRPWRRGNTHRFSTDYYTYLDKTEWKDTPLEKGWEVYFIFYAMFRWFFKPFLFLPA